MYYNEWNKYPQTHARKYDQTSKSLYEDNVKLLKILNYHLGEIHKLKRSKERVLELNEGLRIEKECADIAVKQKIIQNKKMTKYVSEVGFIKKIVFRGWFHKI